MTTKFTNSHKTSFSYFSHYEEKRRLFTDAIQSSGKLDRWQRIPTVFIIHLVCIKSSHDEYLCKKYVYVAYIYIYNVTTTIYWYEFPSFLNWILGSAPVFTIGRGEAYLRRTFEVGWNSKNKGWWWHEWWYLKCKKIRSLSKEAAYLV